MSKYEHIFNEAEFSASESEAPTGKHYIVIVLGKKKMVEKIQVLFFSPCHMLE